MSSNEMDAFRAELLRQKIIFEAELRRQRETFEDQLTRMAEELADREADCRNLQAVVTILGKKVDSLLERRTATPHRRSPSARQTPSVAGNGAHSDALSICRAVPSRLSSPAACRSSPLRRNVNSAAATPRATGSFFQAQSLSTMGSCHESPARAANGQRLKLGNDDMPDHHLGRVNSSRVRKLRTLDD